MATGKLIKLVHLSQQRYLPNTRLVPDHNDKGYGIIEDEQGQEVYFSHEVVENRFGFDDLRKGQQLEYCYYFRGIALYRRGRLDDAIADLGKAIALKQHPRFYADRGNLLVQKGDLDGGFNKFLELTSLGEYVPSFVQFGAGKYTVRPILPTIGADESVFLDLAERVLGELSTDQ